MTDVERFKLLEDEDGHWYVINVNEEAEFEKWVFATYNDLEWHGKDFQSCEVGGSPSQITFTNPISLI